MKLSIRLALMMLVTVSLLSSLFLLVTATASADDPTFLDRRKFGPGKGYTHSVAVGDMNGDGDLDIVAGNYRQQSVVYLNDGAGNFTTERDFGAESNETYSVAVGDMNDDGHLDIVVGNNGQQNGVYLNDGTGHFPLAQPYTRTFGTGSDPTYSVAVGDMNGDGDLDIVAGNYRQRSVVYLNDGAGNFTTERDFGAESNKTYSVAVGDMNDDGHLDIVVGNDGQQNGVYLNDGTGHFPLAQPYTRTFGTGSDPTYSVAVGDMDGDDDLDIVAGNYQQQNGVYLNDGTGHFPLAQPYTRTLCTGSGWTRSVAVGDMNGDGHLDSVQRSVCLNDGAGNFATIIPFGGGSENTYAVAVGDMDSDGALDIVAGMNWGQNVVYLNDGAGNFPSGRTLAAESNLQPSTAVGDMDNDRDLDIVAGGQNVVYLNHGGTFTQAVSFGRGNGRTTLSVAVGHMNDDDHLDIVVGNGLNGNKQNVVYLNNETGSFLTERRLRHRSRKTRGRSRWATWTTTATWTSLPGTMARTRCPSTKAGFFTTTVPFGPESDTTHSVAVGDMDGDSDLDIVVGNESELSVVYLNDGAGNFLTEHHFGPEEGWTHSVAVGDMNGDGDLDIVAGNLWSAMRGVPERRCGELSDRHGTSAQGRTTPFQWPWQTWMATGIWTSSPATASPDQPERGLPERWGQQLCEERPGLRHRSGQDLSRWPWGTWTATATWTSSPVSANNQVCCT